jgi:hypothetical protein
MAISPNHPSLQVLPSVTPEQEQLLRSIEEQIDDGVRWAGERDMLWSHVRPDTDELRAAISTSLDVFEGTRGEPNFTLRHIQSSELTDPMRRWLRLRYLQAGWRWAQLKDAPDGRVTIMLST